MFFPKGSDKEMSEPKELLAALRREAQGDDVESEPDVEQGSRVETTLTAVHDALEGRRSFSDGVGAIQEYRERLDAARNQIEQRLPKLSSNEVSAAFVFSLRALCAGLDARMSELEQALTRNDTDACVRSEARVREVTNALVECQRCLNLALQKRRNEGVVLLPQRYVLLYKATERVARGEIAVGEWLPLLEQVEGVVRGEQQRVRGQVGLIASQLDDVTRELLEEFDKRCADSLQGLASMRKWTESHDIADLNRGWTRMVAATVAIQKILHAIGRGEEGEQRDDRVILEDE